MCQNYSLGETQTFLLTLAHKRICYRTRAQSECHYSTNCLYQPDLIRSLAVICSYHTIRPLAHLREQIIIALLIAILTPALSL